MNNIELFIKDMVDTNKDTLKMIIDMRTSSRARIIWNVGLAGFALLNARPYWDALAEKPITGINNAWLSLPWVLSTFLGVIAYFLIDETVKKEQFYFVSLFNAYELFKIDMEEQSKVDVKRLMQISSGEDSSISAAKKGMLIWGRWTRWFELATFASLVLGFIWSAIGPLILK